MDCLVDYVTFDKFLVLKQKRKKESIVNINITNTRDNRDAAHHVFEILKSSKFRKWTSLLKSCCDLKIKNHKRESYKNLIVLINMVCQ